MDGRKHNVGGIGCDFARDRTAVLCSAARERQNLSDRTNASRCSRMPPPATLKPVEQAAELLPEFLYIKLSGLGMLNLEGKLAFVQDVVPSRPCAKAVMEGVFHRVGQHVPGKLSAVIVFELCCSRQPV